MFYHPREQFVPEDYRRRIFRQLQGNAPVLLIDGVAAGTWETRIEETGHDNRQTVQTPHSQPEAGCWRRGKSTGGIPGNKYTGLLLKLASGSDTGPGCTLIRDLAGKYRG